MFSRACTADLSHCRLDRLLDQACLEKLHEAVLARYEWLSKYIRGQMCRSGDPRCFNRRDLNAWAMDCPGLIVDADMVDKAARDGKDILHLYYTTARVQSVWDEVKVSRHLSAVKSSYVPESHRESMPDNDNATSSSGRVRFAEACNDHDKDDDYPGEHMSRAEFVEFLVRLSVDKHAPEFAKAGGKHHWSGNPHVAADAFDAFLDLHLEHRIGHIISDNGLSEGRYGCILFRAPTLPLSLFLSQIDFTNLLSQLRVVFCVYLYLVFVHTVKMSAFLALVMLMIQKISACVSCTSLALI